MTKNYNKLNKINKINNYKNAFSNKTEWNKNYNK